MRVIMYYFSGTGNTKWVVEKLEEKLIGFGNEVKVMNCEEVNSLQLNEIHEYHMVGIAFPIHSSFAPKLIQDFLYQLPKTKNKPLFSIATAGYIAGDVNWYTTKKLKDKDYIPFLFGNIVVGNNLHLPYLCPLPVTSSKKMKQKLIKAESKINKLAKLINSRRVHKEGISILGRLFGILQRIISKSFEKHAFKGFSVNENCTLCRLCVDNCPTNNITISDNKVKILQACILCMRCYNFCPSKAIQCTKKTKNIKKYKRYQGPKGKGFSSLKK